MNRHPAENELELIFLAPDKVDAAMRREIEGHLEHCDPCRESAALLESFHAELKNSPQSVQNVEDFLKRFESRAKIVELFPYRFVPDATEFGENVMTVLAAKSETTSEYRYSTVCTLVSRNEESLVRILKDHDTEKYRVYLITKHREQIQHALVHFPSLQIDVAINPETQQAEFSLPANRPGIDWMNIVAELRFS